MLVKIYKKIGREISKNRNDAERKIKICSKLYNIGRVQIPKHTKKNTKQNSNA